MKLAKTVAAGLSALALMAAVGCSTTSDPGASGRFQRAGLFKAMDDDGDGRISRQEYYNIYQDQETAGKFFDTYDRNGDGFLDRDEFHVPGITIFKW